jgi:hypothetical protein
MRWGLEHSIGHYLDLSGAVLGLTLFPHWISTSGARKATRLETALVFRPPVCSDNLKSAGHGAVPSAVQMVAGVLKDTPKRSATILIAQQHTQNWVDS